MGIALDADPSDIKLVTSLLKQYLPNTLVWAYGSRVKYTAKLTSDLDLVAFIDASQVPQFYDLKDAFTDSNITFSVDIHNWNSLPDAFKLNIKAQYIVIQKAS